MKLQIDLKKIIKLLAKDIYDTPFALLRENLQNAYDAVLIRKLKDTNYNNPEIRLYIQKDRIIISDNGIGMTLEVIENNYWKAGASGKNNEDARKAGVVGTFGIGAMANYGVCQNLKVESRYYDSIKTVVTELNIEDISMDEDCISTSTSSDVKLPVGTTVTATLNPDVLIVEQEAISYITPYIRFVPFPVYINGNLISKQDFFKEVIDSNYSETLFSGNINNDIWKFNLNVYSIKKNGENLVGFYVKNIFLHNQAINGEIVLCQNRKIIFTLRSGFGLAPIVLTSSFKWGGLVNLSNIIPTAGRDSLTRESVETISSLVIFAEKKIADVYSNVSICDSNRDFLLYVYQHKNLNSNLAKNIKIFRQPTSDYICLGTVQKNMDHHDVRFYAGLDETIKSSFANENNYLLIISKDIIRREIQIAYLLSLGIESVPDVVTTNDYEESELALGELFVIYRIEYILRNDYFLNNVHVYFSEISHNQPFKVEELNKKIIIHIAKNSNSVLYLREVYSNHFSLFDSFVKDYVRQNLWFNKYFCGNA